MFERKTRFTLLKVALISVLLIFVVRLFVIQIAQHEEYMTMARETRIKSYELIAKRGQIYMMSGSEATVPVVMNERTWTVFVDPSYVDKKDEVELQVGRILQDKMIVEWDEVWRDKRAQYVEIAKNVDYDTVAAIKALDFKGVGQKETSRRVYPAGGMASQVLGFVNAEGVGSGIEGALNGRLSGENGLLKTVVDVNSIPLSIGDENIEVPAKDGEDIVLSLDENVQRATENALKESYEQHGGGIKSASAVVMDPNTGRVLAMANYPNYNPEEYWEVTDATLFTNRVTESIYEPASVCKPFTYATALNEGKISPLDTYVNTGTTQVDDRTINNAFGTSNYTGTLTFRTALDHSLNTGSVEVLRRIGDGGITKQARQTLYEYLTQRFGLGQKTGIELYEEMGRIISPDEVQGNAVRYANMTFGQGMSLTMMQVAAGFSALINDGNYYQPTIIAGSLDDNGELQQADAKEPTRRDVVSAETSATMRDMLREVRSVNGGENDPAGYWVGVKTGTAETLDEKGEYTSGKTTAGAIGFGGSASEDALPQYVVMVRLDGNTLLWGSQDAVPVFTQISNYMLQYLRIRPVR